MMISFKGRESKRGRIYKMTRNLERLYKEGKCRECRVLVTRMDFAKILGKFTKVKIQYESGSSPKAKGGSDSNTSNINSRLKCNENGMVLIRRNTYKQHPAKSSQSPKKKVKDVSPDSILLFKHEQHQATNILKENNGMKKNQAVKEKTCDFVKIPTSTNLKEYGIVFNVPTTSNNNNNNEIKSKISLLDMLPNINKSMLPSEDWYIDYFPKTEDPKDDKVYDRIAAELEDLLYNDKPAEKTKQDEPEVKVEEFPSIMDILNDNPVENTLKENDQNNSESFKTQLESNDVEAMLLGKTNVDNKDTESTSMEVDSADVSKLIEDMDQLTNITENDNNKSPKAIDEEASLKKEETNVTEETENPQSPSILDETLQKGVEDQLQTDTEVKDAMPVESDVAESKGNEETSKTKSNNDDKPAAPLVDTPVEVSIEAVNDNNGKDCVSLLNSSDITHVVFKKDINGKCIKSVMCPRSLKYSIELEGKSVEFIGAPKYISSLEDLQVLLQIVNETELESLYVFH